LNANDCPEESWGRTWEAYPDEVYVTTINDCLELWIRYCYSSISGSFNQGVEFYITEIIYKQIDDNCDLEAAKNEFFNNYWDYMDLTMEVISDDLPEIIKESIQQRLCDAGANQFFKLSTASCMTDPIYFGYESDPENMTVTEIFKSRPCRDEGYCQATYLVCWKLINGRLKSFVERTRIIPIDGYNCPESIRVQDGHLDIYDANCNFICE
jgi:hypothetical protein